LDSAGGRKADEASKRTVREECAGRFGRVVDGEIMKFGGVELEPAREGMSFAMSWRWGAGDAGPRVDVFGGHWSEQKQGKVGERGQSLGPS
jgi:hypothetical protein